jgi:hypothetical protein
MKKLTKKKLTATILGFCLYTGAVIGQISEGGVPFSFIAEQKHSFSGNEAGKIVIQEPDLTPIHAEDLQNDAQQKVYRVGLRLPFVADISSGHWESVENKVDLWRLTIQCDNALALGLYFSDAVQIPEGGKLFAYSGNKKHVVGAFSHETDGFEALRMIAGDVLTLEYSAPAGTSLPTINISELVYFYRGVEDQVMEYLDPNYLETRAQSCQIDVACTPERNGWEDQIRSVVHIVFPISGGAAVCSAATINNTAQDCKPYILTAWHCGERNAGDNLNNWVWYWNYQKSTCQPNSNSQNPSKGNETMTGGIVRASSGNGTLTNPPSGGQVAGSDFMLVELNQAIPQSYNPYYAGWSRANTAATSGVGIHHPAGSAKKISTFSSTLSNSSFNGGGFNHFWAVQWVATTNGHGVTEGGSSGSPIFNQNGLIVGQLTGGSSTCNSPNSTDVYGKMSSNWNANGSSAAAQLAPWLDPNNTGATTLAGSNCGGTPPPPPPTGCINPTTTYTMGFEENEDLSNWTVFNVNQDQINGNAVTWGVINQSAFQSGAMTARTGQRLAYYFYNSQNTNIGADDWLVTPCIDLEPGIVYTLSFWYRCAEAGGTIFDEKMRVNIGGAANPSSLTFNLVDLPNINNVTYQQSTSSFTVQTAGEYYIGFHCYSDPDKYILGLDDIMLTGVPSSASVDNPQDLLDQSIHVFPNPTVNKVTVQFNAPVFEVSSITVKDFSGRIVNHHVFENNQTLQEWLIDLSNEANGLYLIQINTNQGTVNKKVVKQ